MKRSRHGGRDSHRGRVRVFADGGGPTSESTMDTERVLEDIRTLRGEARNVLDGGSGRNHGVPVEIYGDGPRPRVPRPVRSRIGKRGGRGEGNTPRMPRNSRS